MEHVSFTSLILQAFDKNYQLGMENLMIRMVFFSDAYLPFHCKLRVESFIRLVTERYW